MGRSTELDVKKLLIPGGISHTTKRISSKDEVQSHAEQEQSQKPGEYALHNVVNVVD